MNSLTYKIDLDCLRRDSQATVFAKVGEVEGRKIIFNLREGRNHFFVPNGVTAVFRAVKPDGTVLYNACEIVNGCVEYCLTSQTVAVEGAFPCELQLLDESGKTIYTPSITLVVVDNLQSDDEIESANEFTELTQAILGADNLNIEIEQQGDTAVITLTKKDGTQQTVTVHGGGGGIPDAPSDGKQYARQDGEWTEVVGGGGNAKAIGRACYNLLDKAVYIGDETDISALKDALWALVGNTLVSISAVFTQGATVVYPSTSLDALKSMLVVTATYDDSTMEEVYDYTLSGVLTEGTSTITATYNGKTATFAVNVTAEPVVPTLDYISAVYTQSGEVYESTALNALKADLVVTAHMTDASTYIVASTDYALSGTITVGTSAITVSYESKTAIFNVTVSPEIIVTTGYVSVGNPIIADKIFTTSNGNYIRTNVNFSPEDKPWEIRAKIRYANNTEDYQVLLGGVNPTDATRIKSVYSQAPRGSQGIIISSDGNDWDIKGPTPNDLYVDCPQTVGTWYWFRFGYDGEKYYNEMSTDGITYSGKRQLPNVNKTVYGGYPIAFGDNISSSPFFKGDIDLSELAIDIDGQPYWKAV